MARKAAPLASKDFAYKGYLVTKLFVHGYAVSKDGHHICYAMTPAEARKAIDEVVG